MKSQLRRGRPPRPPPPPPSQSPSPSPPPSPPRRNLRPRLTPRPLLEDFYGLSSSSGDESEIERKGRRKVKLVMKLSGGNGNGNGNRGDYRMPTGGRHVAEPDLSSSSYVEDEGGSDEEVKPLKKRRISGGIGGREERLGFEEAGHREVRKINVSVSGLKGSVSGLSPKFVKRTPLPDRKTLEEILDKLQKKDTYGVFSDPVDPEELPDYHDVIEHPMDFSTVRRKLTKNVYSSFEQFEDDVFLICSNAMQYNAPDTIYFRQAHSIQELARSKFHKLRDGVKQAQTLEKPKIKTRNLQEAADTAIRDKKYQVITSFGEKHHTSNTKKEEEREEEVHRVVSTRKKLDHKKLDHHKKRKREEKREKPSVSNSNNNKRSFSRFSQEQISSDISSAGTHASIEEAATSLSASRVVDTNNDRDDDDEDGNINNNNTSSNNIKEEGVQLNVIVNGFMDNNSCSLGETQSDKAGDLSAKESPSRPVDTPVVDENRRAPDENKKPVDMNRRKTYATCEQPPLVEPDPIFDIFANDPKHLLSIAPETEHCYAKSLAHFAAFLGPSAWQIACSRIERSLPAGTKFGRGWVGEFEPLSPPVIFVANQDKQLRSSQSFSNNNVREREVQQRSIGSSQVRKNRAGEPFLKPPEVCTPRGQTSNNPSMGQNRNSVQGNHPMGFITKHHQLTNQLISSNASSNASNNSKNNARSKGIFLPVQSVKREAESPKPVGPAISAQNSWISFGGGGGGGPSSYETKPSINAPGPPAFLATQASRPTSSNISNNAPVWRVVNSSPRHSGAVSSSNSTQPMFPMQRDLPWQGFMPPQNHQHMLMKEPQTLRPDLNLCFNSPGSPPGQSSGINLEAQQPDLALQL